MWRPDEFVRRAWRRIARLGKDIVPGTVFGEAIDVYRLICPLRYDIWVRMEFVRLLRDEWALYQEDFTTFLGRPAAIAYYTWYRDVCCARYEPALSQDSARMEAAFLKRVRQTAELWQSMDRSGFDTSSPIRLMFGRSLRSVNGKAIHGRFFAGDGCHRIACLYLVGRRRLEPVHYEVAIQSRLRPIDNTAILIDSGTLDLPAYLRYLSQFYCDGIEFDSVDAIVQRVSRRKPELVPELESVLAYDLPRLGTHG